MSRHTCDICQLQRTEPINPDRPTGFVRRYTGPDACQCTTEAVVDHRLRRAKRFGRGGLSAARSRSRPTPPPKEQADWNDLWAEVARKQQDKGDQP